MKNIIERVKKFALMFIACFGFAAFAADPITTQDGFAAALSSATDGATITLGEGSFTLDDGTMTIESVSKLNFVGAGTGTVLAIGKSNGDGNDGVGSCIGATMSFKDLTLTSISSSSGYTGFTQAAGLSFTGVTFNYGFSNWGNKGGVVTFTNCTFNQETSGKYCVQELRSASGTTFTFDSCIFNSNCGRFINAYKQGGEDSSISVVVKNCTFINTGSANKSALNLKDGSDGCTISLTFVGTNTATGNFPTSNPSPLFQTADGGNATVYLKDTDDSDSVTIYKDNGKTEDYVEPNDYTPVSASVAQIGDTKYASLAAAIEAVPTDGTATTIQMIADETTADFSAESLYTIKSGMNLTLDLNGHTISATSTTVAAHFMFFVANGATFTIDDKSEGTPGTISFTYAGGNAGWKEEATIWSTGDLNLYRATLKNLTDEDATSGMAFVVDQRPNDWNKSYTDKNPVFHMYSGTLSTHCSTCCEAIRLSNYGSSDSDNPILSEVVIDGGTITGWDGVFVQEASSNYHNLKLTINAGTITGGNGAVRVYACEAATLEDVTITDSDKPMTLLLNGGTYKTPNTYNRPTVAGGRVIIHNTTNVNAPENISKYLTLDGTLLNVAQIGETKYATLAAAIDAVTAGQTITLLADVSENIPMTRAVAFTIDTNGKTLSNATAIKVADGSSMTLTGDNYVFTEMFRDSVEDYNKSGHIGYTLNIQDVDQFKTYGFYVNTGSVVNVSNVKVLDTTYFNIYGGTMNVTGTDKLQNYARASENFNVVSELNLNKLTAKTATLNVYAGIEGKQGASLTAEDSIITSRFVSVGSVSTSDYKYRVGTDASALMSLTNSQLLVWNVAGEAASTFTIGGATMVGTLELINSTVDFNRNTEPYFCPMNVTIGANGTIRMDITSSIAATKVTNTGVISINATGITDPVKVIDYTSTDAMTLADYGTVNVTGGGVAYVEDNDLWVKQANFYKDANNVYHILNLAGLKEFREQANAGDLNGQNTGSAGHTKVVLDADIDLNNEEWTPINMSCIDFDGQNHTVKNLKVTGNAKNVGFFGEASISTVKNLTIDTATVTGINHVAAIAGDGLCGHFINCTVKNATITAKVYNNDDGDKAGAICGYLSGESDAEVTNCTVENCTITGYRDCGGAVGYANGTASVTGTAVKDTTVVNAKSVNYEGYTTDTQYDIGQVVGHKAENATVSDNTVTKVEIDQPTMVAKIGINEYDDLNEALVAAKTAGTTCELLCNVDLKDVTWTPVADFNGTFDGKNYKITGLTVTGTSQLGLFANTGTSATIKDLTITGASITSTSGNNQGVLAGSVSGSTISNVKVTDSTVTGNGSYAGGLCGSGYPAALNCEVSGCTINSKDQVGGLNGYQWVGSIKNCVVTNNTVEATEERAGGLVGKIQVASSNLGNSTMYFNGNTVSGTAKAPDMAGGIVGQIMGDDARYEIKNNTINVTLTAPATSPIGVLRGSNADNAFTQNITKNITGNWWEDATSTAVSYTFTNTAITADKNYTVYRGVAVIGDTGYKTFAEAVAAANTVTDGTAQTIKLITDCSTPAEATLLDQLIIEAANVTLDLNEKTLTTVNNFSFAIAANNVTVKNGTIKAGANEKKTTKRNSYALAICAKETDKTVTGIVVDGVTMEGGIIVGASWADGECETECAGGAKVTIRNCDITSGDFYCVYAQTKSDVVIESGRYYGANSSYAIDLENGSTITVKGGIYSLINKTSVVAGEGCEIAANTDEATMVNYPWTVKQNVAKIGDFYYTTLAAALSAAKSGDTITLLVDLADTGSISLPAGVTLDGNGHKITGNSSVYINVAGGTVKNTAFDDIHNSDNKLSAIYATGNFSGTATITDCTFGSCDWDTIQITPVAGANIVITDNTFDTDNANQHRYVHVQSKQNVDFSATVTGNIMKGDVSEGAVEVYYFTDTTKVDLTKNYIEDKAGICILEKSGANVCEKVYPCYTALTADGAIDTTSLMSPVAMIKTTYNGVGYATLADALKGAKSGDTIEILDGTWGADAVGTLDPEKVYTNANIVRSKSLTIQAAKGANPTFTSQVYLGYDDSSTCHASMTVKNLKFDGCSLLISNYLTVDVENCTFVNGTTSTSGTLVVQDACCKLSGKDPDQTALDYTTGSVTIKNCSITGSNTGASGIRLRNTGNVTIENNTILNSAFNGILIEANTSIVNTIAKTVSITGNKITEWNATNTAEKGRAIRLSLGNLASGSTLTVTGNTLRKETLNLDPPDFMKISGSGSATVNLNGNDWNNELLSTVSGTEAYYTVEGASPALTSVVTTKKALAKIGDKEYETLEDAIAAATTGQTITLAADIDFTAVYAAGAGAVFDFADGVTLDLNGKTITAYNYSTVYQGNNLKICNGSFVAANGGSYALFVGDEKETTGVVLENVVCTGGVNCYNTAVTIQGENTEIDGTKYYPVWAEGADVTILAGTYNSGNAGSILANSDGSIEVRGGTYDADPSEYVVKNYESKTTDNETWNVSEKTTWLADVKAAQRYPWNGLVDITFTLKTNKDVTLYVAAYDSTNTRLALTTAKLVTAEGEETINAATGFTGTECSTATTYHIVWDSTEAVPNAKKDGVTFKVFAK